jgi:HEPN domain-containing protein
MPGCLAWDDRRGDEAPASVRGSRLKTARCVRRKNFNAKMCSPCVRIPKTGLLFADYDLESARHMLKTGRDLYVIFLCHLSLEKMLKALVTEITQSVPFKTHDLILLVKKSGLEIPQEHLEFIGKINSASIPTRHPEDLERALKV